MLWISSAGNRYSEVQFTNVPALPEARKRDVRSVSLVVTPLLLATKLPEHQLKLS